MTPRGSRRASLPRSKSGDYARVAEDFYRGAESAKTSGCWNAAGVLAVHAAIAYTDAVTIRIGGVKSRGEDHMAAVDLLRSVARLDERGRSALNHLARILSEKNAVSYGGEIYRREHVDKLWKQLERYRTWAKLILASRTR